MSDETLQEAAQLWCLPSTSGIPMVVPIAAAIAAAFDKRDAEIERLRREIADHEKTLAANAALIGEQLRELAEVTAERDRLRAIVKAAPHELMCAEYPRMSDCYCWKRAALGGG